MIDGQNYPYDGDRLSLLKNLRDEIDKNQRLHEANRKIKEELHMCRLRVIDLAVTNEKMRGGFGGVCLIDFVEKLLLDSFEGWHPEAVKGYKTAMQTIKKSLGG